MAEPFLVVGLGNPGREYDGTRHNVGFMFVEHLAEAFGGGGFTYQKALQGYRCRIRMGGADVVLLKPDTFMNLSGFSVQATASYFKILSQRTVICYDDVDIPCGLLRIRVRGSSGGHRGMASIIEQMGDDQFVRFRFGIRPADGRRGNLAGFVLSDFSSDEQALLPDLFGQAREAVGLVVAGRVSEAMNRYNRKPAAVPAPDGE